MPQRPDFNFQASGEFGAIKLKEFSLDCNASWETNDTDESGNGGRERWWLATIT